LNLVKTGDKDNDGNAWATIGGHDVLDAAEKHPLWQNRSAIQAQGRGVGLSLGGWPGAYEPSSSICMLQRNGQIQLQMALVDLNGTGTGFQMLAAEILGVSPSQIEITAGDTRTSQYGAQTAGSQVTYSTGVAVLEAAREARQQILAIASEQLEAAVEDLEIVKGQIQVRGFPDKGLSFADIGSKTRGMGAPYGPVVAQGRSAQPINAPVFSAQLAEVEVDKETGQVQVHRLVLIQDVGRALNPLTVTGQMHGGMTQGIGWALYEQILYDEYGQPVTASWMDYTVPSSTQTAVVLETVMVEVPSDSGPLGARGVGETPVVATASAIANAIADATGVRLSDLPMTAPRVLAALISREATPVQ
ncbi:MAG TPA: molybdopterin cofactor-binding domain-containing protein, partial [Phototrophicaceae bacterium]|nr:molybdopterin cofactor-binding domain-containing protein [Phototrophicaceae bacterium]